MTARYEATVYSIKDNTPAYLHIEFENLREAADFCRRYERFGSTPNIRALEPGYYLMLAGQMT